MPKYSETRKPISKANQQTLVFIAFETALNESMAAYNLSDKSSVALDALKAASTRYLANKQKYPELTFVPSTKRKLVALEKLDTQKARAETLHASILATIIAADRAQPQLSLVQTSHTSAEAEGGVQMIGHAASITFDEAKTNLLSAVAALEVDHPLTARLVTQKTDELLVNKGSNIKRYNQLAHYLKELPTKSMQTLGKLMLALSVAFTALAIYTLPTVIVPGAAGLLALTFGVAGSRCTFFGSKPSLKSPSGPAEHLTTAPAPR